MATEGISRYCVLMKMYNPDILAWIIISEILRDQTPVAFLGGVLCTEEAAVVEVLDFVSFLDMSLCQQARKDTDIAVP